MRRRALLASAISNMLFYFIVDGVAYRRIGTSNVQVTVFYDNNIYSGDVVIPSSVDYNGVTYNVTSIGNSVFKDCTNLTSVVIPNSVTSIGDRAFYHCTSLTGIEIPNSVTSIGNYAFYNCSSLTSVVIGNSVTSIGKWVFWNCNHSLSVYIKATTPPTLGDDAFGIDTSDRKVYVPRASLNAYKTANGWKGYASLIEPYDY